MIARIYEQDEYSNFIQDAAKTVHDESIIALNRIGVYDIDSDEWNRRRAFWIAFLGLPPIAYLTTMTLAAIKYLWN